MVIKLGRVIWWSGFCVAKQNAGVAISLHAIGPCTSFKHWVLTFWLVVVMVLLVYIITYYHRIQASVTIPIFSGSFPNRSRYRYTGYTNQAEQNGTSSTLTRYGNDLNFDPETCPSDSLRAMSELEHATPLHDDCPTLFIVGARKGGTTSLYQYVSKHPHFTGVRLDKAPNAGETSYFSKHQIDDIQSWQKYRNLFPQDGSMSGESSVRNLVQCDMPRRIFNSCGKQAKAIMLLRNPIERFISNYLMRVRLGTRSYGNSSGVVKKSVEKYLQHVRNRGVISLQIEKEWVRLLCLFGASRNMVFEGMYYVHLLNWLCNFPAENIMIINSEEFFTSPTTILRQVFEFIGLHQVGDEMLQAFTSDIYNQRQEKVQPSLRLSDADREELSAVFEPYNRALTDLLNWKSVVWK